MQQLVAAFDWASTPLGARETWPENLSSTVRILLTSRFPMWMGWGPELIFLYNDAYARTTLGRKHPWALGRPAAEVWSEIWRDIQPRIAQVLETGEASWDETLLLIVERSGYREESYHTFSYSPLTDRSGRNCGMLCVVMEDTARVLGERQVGALSTLAGSLTDAITQAEVFAGIERGLAHQRDLPFALVYLLDREEKTLRLVSRVGIEAGHAAAPEQIDADAESWPWDIRQLLASRRGVTQEDLDRCLEPLPAGAWDTPPTQARLVPIMRQGQEEPMGVFIAGLNPYRQLDASYTGFLDLVAGQLAASITNAQAFEQERKRAESLAELDRAKTAFFSNASHELRTPLTLILGPIEDALAGENDLSRDAVEMLHRNALRLLKLVNGLLDFVRIEAGRLHASFSAVDLAQFTAQLASVFRSAVERAGLRLVVDCPPLPEPVYVDREMWEKVVLNLLSNALKSTFEGEIRVATQVRGNRAEVSVADTGTGIPKSELPKLFRRFQQVEGARRRSHEGTGIGLALVRELVEMHGGTIEVESVEGAGTAFTVSLPFGSSHLPQGHVMPEGARSSALPVSATAYVEEALNWSRHMAPGALPAEMDQPGEPEERPVILLADDNADMRAYAAGLLHTRFRVVTAENGRDALEKIEGIKPDLVVTDIMMPEMDGFALLEALRSKPATRTVPVIMLSARAGEEARAEGIESGADDYLVKPFTARELVAHVEAQLKIARMRREAAEQGEAMEREVMRARQFAWEALEHVPDAFCTLDGEFRVTYLNAAAAALTARTGKQALGLPLWELYPMLVGSDVETQFRRVLEEREPVIFEHNFRNEESDSWFEFHLYPQPGEGLVVYLRNTTETRRAEQALRRSEQLAAAGRLAAGVAHEINNPLEALTNLLFLAKLDTTVGESTKDVLERADQELQRLSHIAARSLKFYRQRTAAAAISLEETVETVLFFNSPDARARSIKLERRYRPAPPLVCLPGEIQQVMTNMIRNALDAIEHDGRLIAAVRPASNAQGDEGVVVTIADTGCGIAAGTLKQIFQPFVTTKGDSGTGLGMWVSKGILDNHHARIAVRSKMGHGTVFRIFFPLGAGEPTPSDGDFH